MKNNTDEIKQNLKVAETKLENQKEEKKYNDSISDIYSFESDINQVYNDFVVEENNNQIKKDITHDSIKTMSILEMDDEY